MGDKGADGAKARLLGLAAARGVEVREEETDDSPTVDDSTTNSPSNDGMMGTPFDTPSSLLASQSPLWV